MRQNDSVFLQYSFFENSVIKSYEVGTNHFSHLSFKNVIINVIKYVNQESNYWCFEIAVLEILFGKKNKESVFQPFENRSRVGFHC